MELLFWLAASLILYVYVGYPLLLAMVHSLSGGRRTVTSDYEPSITLIVSAYNEADVIGAKLDNSLSLQYPSELLEVLVVSDCSSDATDSVVRAHPDPRIRLLRMPQRGGKTVGLNAAVNEARGDILVFSDANAMYVSDALLMLARNFADPNVGAVIGESTYSDATAGADAEESLYWRYEVMIKRLESSLGSTVGGDGAIYAIRKSLYKPMRADALSDFVNPLQIVASGFRCIYEPRARSIEKAAGDFDREFRRKVRIVNRAWRATMSSKSLLNPLRFGVFSWQFASHKLLRWLVPLFLVVCLLANVALVGDHVLYRATLVVQGVLYALAAIGYVLRGQPKLPRVIAIPCYFVMVNIASARGIIEAYLGKTYTTWATARQTES
jgi:cellulose synthase/poly-beta-1,6-N-acetylglucosamine synthase-like glycosyltransferase